MRLIPTAKTIRTALGAITAIVALWSLLSYFWFIEPQLDDPGTADVIFVLAGVGDRTERGLELARQGVADEILFASSYVEEWEVWAVRPCNESGTDMIPQGVTVHCGAPDPATTRGEARLLREYAEVNGWDTVVVVASTDQVTRARRLIERCYDGEIRMADVGPDEPWISRVLYEWGAGVKATILRGC